MTNLKEKHQEALDSAIKAIHERKFFTLYPENPSPEIYGENADKEGREKYKGFLNKNFEYLLQQNPENWVGQEESPYTQEKLNVKYPFFSPETLIANADKAFHQWRKVSPSDRAAILVESLERLRTRFFDIAYATMHTTGQAFMMSFQASGPHAADRALEAIATGLEEQSRFPMHTEWEKPMGKYSLRLNKSWKAVPKGISLVIGCSTFPTWNTVPGMYASLVTGNPVIVKPHPKSVLPIAIVIAEVQKVLQENGMDPNICQLAVDADDRLITKDLAENLKVKLIDYTGGTAFGNYVESLPGKTVFTEKAGVNSIILDSVDDLDKVAQNLAFSVTLYSGQMCTAPQNFFVPETGVKVNGENVPYETVAQKLAEAVTALVNNPKAGPHVLGAIQNVATSDRVQEMASMVTIQPGRLVFKLKPDYRQAITNNNVQNNKLSQVLQEIGASAPVQKFPKAYLPEGNPEAVDITLIYGLTINPKADFQKVHRQLMQTGMFGFQGRNMFVKGMVRIGGGSLQFSFQGFDLAIQFIQAAFDIGFGKLGRSTHVFGFQVVGIHKLNFSF